MRPVVGGVALALMVLHATIASGQLAVSKRAAIRNPVIDAVKISDPAVVLVRKSFKYYTWIRVR